MRDLHDWYSDGFSFRFFSILNEVYRVLDFQHGSRVPFFWIQFVLLRSF